MSPAAVVEVIAVTCPRAPPVRRRVAARFSGCPCRCLDHRHRQRQAGVGQAGVGHPHDPVTANHRPCPAHSATGTVYVLPLPEYWMRAVLATPALTGRLASA